MEDPYRKTLPVIQDTKVFCVNCVNYLQFHPYCQLFRKFLKKKLSPITGEYDDCLEDPNFKLESFDLREKNKDFNCSDYERKLNPLQKLINWLLSKFRNDNKNV